MALSRSERVLRGRVGAHRMHALHDTLVVSRPGREAFLQKFLLLADPDGVLSEEERQRRAKHLLAAHMSQLAYQRIRHRRKNTNRSASTAAFAEANREREDVELVAASANIRG